ncbi:MAG: dockerin type I domain-containing protein [Phycisphaerae bacterium]
MGKERSRRRLIRSIASLGGCVVVAGVMGCFLQPMPLDRETLSDSATPEERFIDDPVDPVVEELIRPLGEFEAEPIEELEEIEEIGEAPVEGFADLNQDGLIDDEDIATFRQQFGNFTEQDEESSADLDGDGVVTLIDFQMFLTLVASAAAE